MIKNLIFIIAFLTFLSCKQAATSSPDKAAKKVDISSLTIGKEQPTDSTSQYIHTRYAYDDSSGNKIFIENSLPKGGLTYTDPLGIDYVYTVFWTRNMNEANDTFAFELDFPTKEIKLPSSANNAVKLYLPPHTMSRDKVTDFNYGLDVEAFLKNDLPSSSLAKSIAPGQNFTFYVLALFNKAVEGRVRTGLSIEGQKLFYTINDLKIPCGQINLPGLELQ